jgi:hypothetical protein
MYDDDSPLDRTQSAASDGTFMLRVPGELRTFTVTYCDPRFYPRSDVALRNHPDRSPVVPNPVRLLPRDIRNDGAAYEAIARSATLVALNNLAYIASVDPGRFEKSISELVVGTEDADRRQEILQQLVVLVQRWAE